MRLPLWTLSLGVVAFSSGRADEVWRLDNLKTIAGHPVQVVGNPQVGEVNAEPCIRFDGAQDGLFVSNIPTAGAREFTIEVLFCPAEGGQHEQRFFHMQDSDGRRALIEIRTNAKGGWWLDAFLRTKLVDEDKGLALIDPTRVHPTNQWYWVAMRYDGKHLAAFLNGAKELEGAGDFTALGQGKTSIGVRQNLVYWFKGAIREVRFHREAIAEEKLQRLR